MRCWPLSDEADRQVPVTLLHTHKGHLQQSWAWPLSALMRTLEDCAAHCPDPPDGSHRAPCPQWIAGFLCAALAGGSSLLGDCSTDFAHKTLMT